MKEMVCSSSIRSETWFDDFNIRILFELIKCFVLRLYRFYGFLQIHRRIQSISSSFTRQIFFSAINNFEIEKDLPHENTAQQKIDSFCFISLLIFTQKKSCSRNRNFKRTQRNASPAILHHSAKINIFSSFIRSLWAQHHFFTLLLKTFLRSLFFIPSFVRGLVGNQVAEGLTAAHILFIVFGCLPLLSTEVYKTWNRFFL